MNLNKLNKYCIRVVDEYKKIKVGKHKIVTPYFINTTELEIINLLKEVGVRNAEIDEFHKRFKSLGVNYAWFLGKGKPEDIEKSIVKLLEIHNIDVNNLSGGGILDNMRFYGIGIDCSGFVYNMLIYAFSKVGKVEQFKNSLAWTDDSKQTVYRAGSFVFANKASVVIKPNKIQPLDLILIKNINLTKYKHVAIILRNRSGYFVAQSTFFLEPNGVCTTNFKVLEGNPIFNLDLVNNNIWEQLHKNGRLEFRRLKIIKLRDDN